MGVWTPGPGPTTGDDTFVGDNTNEVASGGEGNDTLFGNGGSDTLNGGDNDDVLAGGLANDIINGDAGNDTINWAWGDGIDTIDGGADFDTYNITGSAADNILRATWNGSVLTHVLDGAISNVEAINADMAGGIDWLIYTATAGVTVNLQTGTASGFNSITNVENVIGGDGNDTISGNGAANRLEGGLGDDVLNGAAGSDNLIGGDGSDTLWGGLAGDSLNGGAGNDTLIWNWGEGADTLNGGADFDTLNATGSGVDNLVRATWNGSVITNLFDNVLISIEAINVDMGGGTDWLIYTATAGVNVNLGAGTASGFASLTNVENVIGGSGGDTITGSAGDNRLDGGDGDDTINGGAGIDIVIGGLGADTLSGGLDNDNVIGDAGNDTLIWNWGDGRDTLNGGADFDTLNATGSAAENIVRATWNGSAITNLFDNVLIDIEAINLDMGGDTDWLIYSTSFDITVNLALGTGTGFASLSNIENVITSTGNDTITGNAAANRIDGGAGNDNLSGGGGVDVLIGGDGADTLAGGTGNDTIVGGAGDDTINWAWGDGADAINGGLDFDTLNIVGSAAENILTATYDGTVLTSVVAGNLVSVEAVNADMGGGTDWLIYTTTSAVNVNLALGTATGFASITSVENVVGASGDDTLSGDATANRLVGGAGSDTLFGDDGADVLLGGADADTVHGGGGVDMVFGEDGDDILLVGGTLDSEAGETYDGGDGFDTLRAQGTPGSTAEFRFSTLVSIEAVTLQNMTAYFAAEALGVGLASALVVDGLNVDNGIYFQRSTAGATDLTTLTFQNWTAGSMVTLEGSTGDDTLTGSSQRNTLIGGDGSDTLVGGALADTLNGGDGTDFLTGGAGVDIINGGDASDHIYIIAPTDLVAGETYDGGAHNDDHIWLQAAGSYSFVGVNVANMELLVLNAAGINVTLTGESIGAGWASDLRVDMTNQASTINVVRSTAGTTSLADWTFFNPNAGTQINLTGSSGDDVLTGSSRQDTISGGDGADTLHAGAGNDTLIGGAGDDTYVLTTAATITEAVGEGTDTVLTSINLTLAANVENATVVGAAGLTITGNASDNVITGGDGSDVLSGAGGADTLIGGADVDHLTGGAGLDTIDGGDGSDHIYITAPADLVAGETYDGGAHNDDHIWLQAAGSYNFAGVTVANMELLVTNAASIDVTLTGESIGAGWDSALRVDFTNQASTINVVRSGAGTTSLASWVFFNNGGGAQINLIGSAGADVLTGSTLGDTIIGGLGVDQLYGGDGDDFLRMNDNTALIAGEVYDGGAGTDTLVASLDINDVRNATVTSIERVAFVGVAPTQVLYVDADDMGAGFSATLEVDGGNVGEAVVYTYRLSAGTADASGWTFANWSANSYVGFLGSSGNDILIGSSVNDLMNGDAGQDTLSGGLGNDELYGGAGNDTIEGGAGDDLMDGEGDTDTASYANASAGVTVDLGNAGAQNTVGAGTDTLANIENLTGSAFNDTLTGDAGANVLTGGGGMDTLTGGAGVDTVLGGAGNDTLRVLTNGHGESGETYDGGADTDTLLLGEGNDFRGATFTSIEALTFDGTANTSLFDAEDFGGAGFAGNLAVTSLGGSQNIELHRSGAGTTDLTGWTFSGTVQVYLYGSAAADTLYGSTQGDIIVGGDGNDHLDGFSGDDTIEGGNGDDYIDASTGTDTVTYANASAGVTVSLATNAVQNTVGAGSDQIFNAENLTGSAFADTLTGDGGANVLTGGAGADTLNGAGGIDSVFGGAGDDTLEVLINGHGASGEVYNGGADTDTLRLGEGNDFRGAIFTSIEAITFTGVANTTLFDAEDFGGGGFADNLSVTSLGGSQNIELHRSGAGTTDLTGWTFSGTVQVYLYGSAAADTFYGTTQGDIIVGGDGNDHLDGFSGDDTIEGGNGDDYIDASTGNDTVTYANASAGVTVSLATNAVQNTVGAGSDQIFNAENLTGSAFADTLTGDGGANTIIGGAGNDTIEGGAGNDTLDGGADIDTASYANAGSGVTVNLSTVGAQNTVGAGTDTLSNFENLTGSAFADTLTGSAGANTILGGAGNDTIEGGDGDDTLDGGADTDTVTYVNAAAGVVVNLALLTAQNTVGAGTDTLSNFENLTGSAFADVLRGDDGANVLSGGAGNDTLEGGLGNDTLDGGADSDAATYANATSGVTVSLAIAGAQDTVGAGTDTLSNIENLTGSAFNDTLTGDANENVIVGAAGNDTLNGGGGDDLLNGGAGLDTINGGDGEDVIVGGADNDTLTGGADADVFVFGAGAGTDTITDFDADPTGGQDIIDITQFGITSGDFAARVTITDLGADTQVVIDGSVTIILTGVDGNGNNVITIDDFGLI